MEYTNVELLVLETLRGAASQNIEILKQAELKLKEWEIQPGFYSTLLKIVSNHSIDVTLRWMAVTYIKNGVDCYWRKSAPNAIKDEEKIFLRNGFMETLREPVNQVAIQIAVLISKAARFDCPYEWPELIPNLLELAKSDDLLIQHRGLLTLYQVIKMLSSKRLACDRNIFQNLAADIFAYILNIWNSHYENFFSQVQNNDPQYQGTLERALLSLKILCKLTVYGFKEPHQFPDVVSFLTLTFDKARKMLYFRKTIENKSDVLRELVEKTIINLIKVLLLVIENYPTSYINLIQTSLEFSVAFLFTEAGDGLLFEKFTVHCMNILKAIISCPKYKFLNNVDTSKGPDTIEAHHIKSEFFQANTVAEICRKLIIRYFVLTKEELQLWDSDPECFEDREMSNHTGASWKISLRACTYSLFHTLFHEYKESLTPVLFELIQSNQHLVDPQDLDAILRKDAVYNAIGLIAFDLYDEVDFDQWFSTLLLQELKIKEPNYRIIRRRVSWLIGKWVDIKFSPKLRPTLYSALILLLRGDEDMAIRLSAAVALKQAIDDFMFDSEQFLQFLEPAFSLLFVLLQEVEESNTKLRILYVMSSIMERMELTIIPNSQSIIRYLSLLWNESLDHMLRCAIVTILVRFVKALITENLTYFLFSVIELCTDLNEGADVYLLEDGLELWCAVVENSISISPQLLRLYKAMPPVLEFTTDHLKCCTCIIEAYILLGPQQFLAEYGESVISSCSYLLTDLDSNDIVLIMKIIETAIRANISLAINISMPLIKKILLFICSKKSFISVTSMVLVIISRVVLYSKDIFSQILSSAAQEESETSEKLLEKVLTVWLHTMPLVTQKEKSKLLALALSSLITVESNTVMSQFPVILKNIVGTLNDIVDMDDPTNQIDSLIYSEEYNFSHDSEFHMETENDRRKKQLMEADPVYNIELRNYLQMQINDLKNKLGTSNFETLLRLVDSEILEQCQLYITLQ